MQISKETRAAISRDYAAGMRQVDVAAKHGVAQSTVSRIVGVRRADRVALRDALNDAAST